MSANPHYDFVIIGSGFGGAVSAMRLSQKGYRVAILESGKRWTKEDFPKSNWNLRKYLWMPRLGCFGIQCITLLKGVMVLHGTGVGGGSLVYANTLMKPKPEFFNDPSWPPGRDWESELAPYYEVAKRMLGVVPNPAIFEGEEALRKVGERMGVASTYHPTQVGVYFGEPGFSVPDPYFSGKGPARSGCIFCGGCMVGCRHGAKNSLDQNYLYFAEKWGAEIFPETKAKKIQKTSSRYIIEAESSTALFSKTKVYEADRVIVAAGVLGSIELLLRNRDVYKTLPEISNRLGENVRTNGETLLGATSFEKHRDLSRGIAIGAAIHADAQTKIESVRYPSGSGAMRLLGVPLTGPGSLFTRPVKLLINSLRKLHRTLRLWMVRDWARNTIILLVMQTVDHQMRLRLGRSLLSGHVLKGASTGKSLPSYSPVAQQAAQILSEELNGEAQNVISEVLLGTPATAHILGGCSIGNSEKEGVVDANHAIHGYSGIFVCDGSVIPANLGVNPSLTITAMAERFCAQFPVADQALFEDRTILFSSSI
jgi:cholesterol oxidase